MTSCVPSTTLCQLDSGTCTNCTVCFNVHLSLFFKRRHMHTHTHIVSSLTSILLPRLFKTFCSLACPSPYYMEPQLRLPPQVLFKCNTVCDVLTAAVSSIQENLAYIVIVLFSGRQGMVHGILWDVPSHGTLGWTLGREA